MQAILRGSLKVTLAAAIALLPAYLPVYAQSSGSGQDPQPPAPAQQPAPDASKPDATKTDSTKQDPKQPDKDKQTQDQKKSNTDVKRDAPVAQQDTVHPKNSKEDVDAIGNRKLGGFNMHSLETDIAIGKQYAQEVERSSKLIDDPIVVEYVNRVGQNLVRNSDARVPFTIKVIDSDEVNAFALPGGFFYVNSGLILRANEEAELAGVMAHEIAHVAARHGTKQATKGDLVQIASIPAMIFIPYSWAGYAMYQGMNFLIPMTFLKFSRDAEREADFLGLQYMYKAGYDPNSFVTFFERIQADEKRRPGTIPKVFSTHPPTPDRIESAQKEIARILPNKPEYIVTTSEFDNVKARLRNIMFARKVQDNQAGKPTLRTRTEQQQKGQTQGQDP